MNVKVRKGATLLVTLGFLFSVLVAMGAPSGASSARAGNFDLSIAYKNAENSSVTEGAVGVLVKIEVTVGIAAGGTDVNQLIVTLFINDQQYGTPEGPFPLSSPNTKTVTWEWTPDTYGDFHIKVTAINDDDQQTLTDKEDTFTVRGSDLKLGEVTVSPGEAVIGIDEVTITAKVSNSGNADGIANVTFKLDGTLFVGNNETTIPASGHKDVILVTTFEGLQIEDGEHYITAVLNGQTNNSPPFSLANPRPDIQLKQEPTAEPQEVTITKGAEVNVTITAVLTNAGNVPAVDFQVSFYVDDTLAPAATVTITEAVEPEGTKSVEWNWLVTDATPLGNHTIYVGVGSQTDWPYWASVNITVRGEAHLFIQNLTVFPEAEFEGSTVTITATVANDGTADAVDVPVTLIVGTETVETKNVTVLKGATENVVFTWALPEVEADTELNVKVAVAGFERSANLTVKNRTPVINITDFVVPAELRIGDEVEFRATIKNEGSGDAIELLVEFFDGTTKLTNTTINLTAGSTKDVVVIVNITGIGDVNHTFYVKALGAEKNVTVLVGHKLAPANIIITGFTVKPKKKEGQPKDSTQSYTLTITLKNTGELPGTVVLNVTEGKKLLTPIPITLHIEGGKELTQNITWKVTGEGKHTAVATISGDAAGSPNTKSVSCELHYTPGFEALLLVAAIVVAAAMIRRRKK
ncbi:MAG: CARDB domain-containing protein [Thermoplasmata archaeon]